ncbi:MAG: 3-deoxy-manno-octulosonate cytidylyltransferase (CMP-KDO synthetase) [Lentisphaeria bacterium]|jgi:3-deoxy-manno-octulosonate cytidylyltransferase (CMP-KDO synthetase)
MSFTVVIPARYASQRLPGKPLADIAGKPMIEHVYRCAQKSDADRVVVATDDQRVVDAVKGFGGQVCMTSNKHESGTDRLEEVARLLSMKEDDIIVNVQGDEPLLPASVIKQVAFNLIEHPTASAATLAESIESIETVFDPNAVKVVCDTQGFALYFSRASIPWSRDSFTGATPVLPADNQILRHIGIYAYRVKLLHQFVAWPVSQLEKCEKLEQLRILSNGHKIHVATACEAVPGGVDTLEDLNRINALINAD